MLRRNSLLILSVVLLLATAPAQVTNSSKGYLLRMKWAKDATYSYVISVAMATMKEPMQAGQFTIKVLSVANGIANVNYTGSMMTQAKIDTTVKMDSRGAVDQDASLRQLGGPRLPEKPLAIGAKWSVTQNQAMQGASIQVTSTYTFKGIQSYGKVRCAVLDVATTTSGGVATKSSGKVYLEAANGQLFRLDLETTVSSTQPGSASQFKTKTVISRK